MSYGKYTPTLWEMLLRTNTIEVGPDNASRQAAVRQLVRPDEVHDLITSDPRPSNMIVALTTFPERLAQWLRGQLLTGVLRYLPDPPSRDIWQAPAYTRRRGGGDCEDLALFVLSLLRHEDIAGSLVTGTANGTSHAWVEGRDERGWFLIEATSGAFKRGTTYMNGQVFRPAPYFGQRSFSVDAYERIAA